MPASVQDNVDPDRSEQMWKVLKAHILRERARKKQEREAEVEEERLRKEREAREQQDVMTLGETREQISLLETKLTQLKEEKHQLFLQLKKVLNEDDNRRRQLIKESSEQMIAIQALPSPMVHPQLYIQPQQAQPPTRIQAIVPPPQQQVQPQAPPPQQAYKAPAKRPRSPSPPPQAAQPMYPYGYKPAGVGPAAAGAYQSSPQSEYREDDGRRNELVRAVLWNKTPQYSQPSAFYPVAPQELSIYYPPATRSVYESPRPQAFQLDHKLPDHYAALHGHVIHPTAMSINPGQPSAKGGSITAGYPVRSQYQQQVPTSTLYTTQSRPIYQSSGGPISYQPRD